MVCFILFYKIINYTGKEDIGKQYQNSHSFVQYITELQRKYGVLLYSCVKTELTNLNYFNVSSMVKNFRDYACCIKKKQFFKILLKVFLNYVV